MLLLRANTLALGHSGCRPLIVDRLLAMLDHGIHPVVPEQGSVGASGDLAPLAHLALPLIGRGEVEVGGRGRAGRPGPPRGRARAARARAEGGPRAPQRHAADGRHRGAPARRRRPARADRVGRRRDERRGPSRDGRGLRRRLPARAAAPGPGGGRRAAPAPAARQRPPAQPSRFGPQGPGPVLPAVRAAGPRGRPGCPRPPPPRAGHRAQLRDRQPARLRRRGRGAGRRARDRRRPGHQRRQLPRGADRARARLRQARARRARLDQRAPDGAPRRSAAQRRAAALPGRRFGHRFGDDDLPVHGRRPRQRAQGARPSRVGRFDPDEREPGGSRLDGRDLGAPCPTRPRGRRADPVDRAPGRDAGAGPAPVVVATRRRRGSASRRREPASVPPSRTWTRIGSPGPDLASALDLVHRGALVDLAG